MDKIELLLDPGDFTRQFYLTVYNSYVEEFGLAWVLKEMSEARDCVTSKMKRSGSYNVRVAVAVNVLFVQSGKAVENKLDLFIGTRLVKPDEWAIYAKGLYWLAGYDLIQNKN